MSTKPEEAADPKRLLHHAERVLYLRIGAGVVLYMAFMILDISAALSHTMQERAPLLLGLLIAWKRSLPRTPQSRCRRRPPRG